ncbi:MAG: MmcB family DNA repair protein [Alphaproteobacteria bacterium]|nr:MmcB family DNA repair protein [Alphaproteobacteria bacterium]
MSIADEAAAALSADGALLARGVSRSLAERGYACLCEFSLANGRRADVMALGRRGEIAIVEVKSSLADFRADRKWPDYWDFCDRLYFAVDAGFPRALLPADCGLMIADPFGAAILREPVERRLGATRRRAVTLRFALAAAQRLRRLVDPGAGGVV